MKTALIRIACVFLCTALGACSNGGDDDFGGELLPSVFRPLFDPANGVVPFPTDLLFSGSLDGTLNIPVADAADFSDPQVALNALDGFSTLAPLKVVFSQSLTSNAANLASSVRVFSTTTVIVSGVRIITGISAALTYGVDYVVTRASTDAELKTLAILPLRPLSPRTTYLVAITDSLQSADGDSAKPDSTYALTRYKNSLLDGDGHSTVRALTDAQATALEPLRILVNYQDAAMNAYQPDLADEVVLAWSFTTQSITDVLSAVRASIRGLAAPAASLVDSSADSPLSAADIYVGTLQVPYYHQTAANVNDPTPLSSVWQAATAVAGEHNLTALNPSPQVMSSETIPLMASIPKAGSAPWPVIIYQHGITQNRATLLALADTAAQAGYAVVAIDLPMHGLTGNETNGTQAFYMAGVERTFDLDLVTQDSSSGDIIAATPDSITDTSGRHFINLSNLLNSRDNMRQAIADLFSLTYAVSALDFDAGHAGADFDTGNMRFIGHSLGGIVGTAYLALESDVSAAVLAMPGGGVAKLLDASASFGPQISAGLYAAAGLQKGSADYESFFAAAQTAIDAADPMNYAVAAAAAHDIMVFEVVGDGGSQLSDQVIPNHVGTLANGFLDAPSGTVPSPIAGTDPLCNMLGSTVVTGSDLTTGSGSSAESAAWLRFTAGDHGSLLSPASNAVVTGVMQAAMATHFVSNGAGFDVSSVGTYASVVE